MRRRDQGGRAAAAVGGAASGGEGGALRIAVGGYVSSWDQDFVGFDLTALMLFKNVFPYMIDYGVKDVGGAQILDTESIAPPPSPSRSSRTPTTRSGR
ncbi:hypothetical protein ACFSTC_39415 [Nonomuraea ferruginea]